MQKPIIEQLSKNEIPYDQIMYAYHLRILELMQKYNINLSQANIESFLSPFSDEDGNFKPSQSNTFIQLRNEIQINEQFINFLYDLLNQFNYEGDIFNIDYIFSTFKDLFSLDELCNNINSIITDLISNNYNTDGINEQELDFLLENKFLSTYLFKISVHNI